MANRWDAMIVKEVNGKNYWTKIGAMFENRSGNGFSVVLDAIPPTVDGAYRISMFEPKENNDRNNNDRSSERNGNNSGGDYSSGRPGSNRGGLDDDIPF